MLYAGQVGHQDCEAESGTTADANLPCAVQRNQVTTEAYQPWITVVKGIKIAFLAYTALTNGQRVPHPWTLDMARAGPTLPS